MLLVALAPFAVTLITNGVKKLGAVDMFTSGFRKNVLRFLVALFSYLAVVGTAVASGQEVSLLETQTFVDALVVFLGSTGVYFFSQPK